ncbi:MAG: hypothetical protein PHW95_01195 [Patescibacteria group bacterium]|nr:hypothetical protein [Patescibacteria group bacterium]
MPPKKNHQDNNFSRLVLKAIVDIWGILTIILFFVDFLSNNRFDSSASVIGIIYLAILGIYASDKEFSRWKNSFISRFLGEIFVIAWTAIMIIFVVTATISHGQYKVPADFAVVYTSVLGVFAITQRSKELHEHKPKTLAKK